MPFAPVKLRGLRRPVRLIGGLAHFLCRGPCGQWKTPDAFYWWHPWRALRSDGSGRRVRTACQRLSVCKACDKLRRTMARQLGKR